MTFLNDYQIAELGDELVQPFRRECVQPASIDLHLGDEFMVPDLGRVRYIDLRSPIDFMKYVTALDTGFVLHPHEFVLGVTEERVTLPDNIVGQINGKSTIGRLGLMIHVTAGFIDPGFRGPLTLEMKNLLGVPIVLYPGEPICQVVFSQLEMSAAKPYDGRYQDSEGVVAARTEV